MARCQDCGCTLEGQICSNCQEELFIIVHQADYITEPVSDEFAAKAKEQQETLRRRNR